jgi:hypothetical protein
MITKFMIILGLIKFVQSCSLENKFSSSCPNDAKTVPFTNNIIETVLSIHNSYRNKIAAGLEPPFKPASNMKVLVTFFYIFVNHVQQKIMKILFYRLGTIN